MKERPILFSPPMVAAILDGRKTQTRRVVKPDLVTCVADGVAYTEDQYGDYRKTIELCPHGAIGDRLWVKEALVNWGDHVHYKINGALASTQPWTWQKPVLHGMYMPRWAARIFLEVTDIRVERLQDITEEDAGAEGYLSEFCGHGLYPNDPLAWFEWLWDSISGDKHPWASNPFVWVIEFRRVQP